MDQLKVFEFAKEIGMETLALMDKIREWKLPVKSHMATLDDSMIAEIRQRLKPVEDAPAATVTKKKVAKKKADVAEPAAKAPAVRKATATQAEAAPAKTVEKKAPAAKRTVKTAAASAAADAAKPARNVIRRKAGEAEARAEELKMQAEAKEAQAAEAAAQEENFVAQESATQQDADTQTPAVPVAPAPGRRNIVGRMDLKRVEQVSTQYRGSGGQQGGQGAAGAPRTSRSAPQRNIRAGFYAVPPPVAVDDFDRDNARDAFAKAEEREKKKPGGTGREGEQVAVFTATEFRKREVIFQPKKKKVSVGRDAKKTQLTTPAAHKRVLEVENTMSVSTMAQEMGLKATDVIKKLMSSGVMGNINTVLDFDTISLIAPEFGWEAQNVHKTSDELLETVAFGELDAETIIRPPVVTVMGHVDHGKTSLLDAIRSAEVAQGEAGGITQHIGAYSVKLESGDQVTFIDTPGHEAFTAMRARGANVTDIAIIVVAADDGVMPQTAEAINHAKAANVPIIVAVNKMDKQGANPDRIKQQLTEFELVPEEWGGTTIFCPVSALKKEGIKELLEQILVVAEVQELKANPKRSGTGIVIESRMEKGRGSVATILVQDGTVKVGDLIVAGTVSGRVRSLMNDRGETVKETLPGFPVEMMGLPSTPQAGDRFDIVKDEAAAERLSEQRIVEKKKASETPSSKMSLDQLFSKVKTGDVKELALVLKADVAGSLEAVKAMLEKQGNEEVKIKLIHGAVGGVTESDVLLASTAQGVILGFNVRPDGGASRMAKEKGIEIKTYSIIYELIDDMKKALSGLLAPTVTEKEMGRAEVRNTFSVPKLGTIAGCFVVDGKIARNNTLRLVRDGKVIYTGKLASLKRFKDDAKEVATGFECGIGIENFNDIKVGDIIEAFVREEVVREL